MGFLKGLFGGEKGGATQEPAPDPFANVQCVHTTVVPRWDNAEDMGKSDKVSVYHCEGCDTDFTPAELEAARPA